MKKLGILLFYHMVRDCTGEIVFLLPITEAQKPSFMIVKKKMIW